MSTLTPTLPPTSPHLHLGGINETTRAWRPVQQVGQAGDLKDNPDVFTMSYEDRAVDLDLLAAPPGQVLTGIKLRRLGGHLNLEIQVGRPASLRGNLSSCDSTLVQDEIFIVWVEILWACDS